MNWIAFFALIIGAVVVLFSLKNIKTSTFNAVLGVVVGVVMIILGGALYYREGQLKAKLSEHEGMVYGGTVLQVECRKDQGFTWYSGRVLVYSGKPDTLPFAVRWPITKDESVRGVCLEGGLFLIERPPDK